MARIATANRVASTRLNTVLRNGGFESKPGTITAATNTANRWIDGTASGSTAQRAFGWATPSAGSGVGVNADIGFDTTVSRSGGASLKLSNLTVTGAVTAASTKSVSPVTSTAHELFRLLPDTQYTITGYIRTNNVPANGALIQVREFSSAFASLGTISSSTVGGTDTTFRQVTATFTANAGARYGCIFLRNNTSGNICDAWFDDITLVPAPLGRAAP